MLMDLPFTLKNQFDIEFDDDFSYMASYDVYADAMRDVLMEPDCATHQIVYRVYRDIARMKDRPRLQIKKMHLDLTVIAPGLVGTEFNKGTGHYHPTLLGGVPEAEIYQVLKGELIFVLQKTTDLSNFQVEDLEVVRLKEGEIIIVPPYYGHSFVNIADEVSVAANLTVNYLDVNREVIRERQGMAVYIVSEDGQVKTVINPNYDHLPDIRFGIPEERAEYQIDFSKS
ncbi:MAG: glucose-6-phosphate isomerase family protein, partial [bacterium]